MFRFDEYRCTFSICFKDRQFQQPVGWTSCKGQRVPRMAQLSVEHASSNDRYRLEWFSSIKYFAAVFIREQMSKLTVMQIKPMCCVSLRVIQKMY